MGRWLEQNIRWVLGFFALCVVVGIVLISTSGSSHSPSQKQAPTQQQLSPEVKARVNKQIASMQSCIAAHRSAVIKPGVKQSQAELRAAITAAIRACGRVSAK
jgi:hypothetical protein